MKIGPTKVGGAERPEATEASAPHSGCGAGCGSDHGADHGAAVLTETRFAGIPEAELTPRVRDALLPLAAEAQKLRAELSAVRGRLRELEDLANADPLLGILNRRAFMRELQRALAMIDRYGVEACLVFLDVDGLKGLNDDKGHAAGDAALKHVAGILTANVRRSDAVGRLGGDEFGVLLTHVSAATARKKAAALAGRIADAPVEWGGGAFTVRASFGVAPLAKEMTADDAMERADGAMYETKRKK